MGGQSSCLIRTPDRNDFIIFQSLASLNSDRIDCASAWPAVCITKKREEQVASCKSKRKGACHENQDEREGWTHDGLTTKTSPSGSMNRRGNEAKHQNQQAEEDTMKTKTNVKAGLNYGGICK
jgi:hypothetical protein